MTTASDKAMAAWPLIVSVIGWIVVSVAFIVYMDAGLGHVREDLGEWKVEFTKDLVALRNEFIKGTEDRFKRQDFEAFLTRTYQPLAEKVGGLSERVSKLEK